jgi:hypothetical protein
MMAVASITGTRKIPGKLLPAGDFISISHQD